MRRFCLGRCCLFGWCWGLRQGGRLWQLRARLVVSALAEDGATPKAPEPPLQAETLLFLIGAAALWGTYPTCVKLLYTAGPTLDPSVVVLLRFLIMAAVSVSALLGTTPKFTLLRRYKVAQAASMPAPPTSSSEVGT